MKVQILCVGSMAYKPFKEAVERYSQRLVHYVPFEIKEIPDLKNTKSLSTDQQKTLEGNSLLAAMQQSDWVMLLDERGREYTSREFSKLISDKMSTLPGRLVLVIGGPYGFSQSVYDRANGMISLSKMTLPHELARLMLTEQLYRALTILRGEPYHHD